MDMTAIQTAAGILADLRLRSGDYQNPIADLPSHCRPQTLHDAYQLQAALRVLLAERGLGPQVGWKIGCTTPVMQRYLDIAHPCAGTLYQHTSYAEFVSLDADAFFQLGLECELAVRLAADIPPRPGGHNVDSVREAVTCVMTSVEIVEHRFTDFNCAETASLIADDFFSVGCVLGQETSLSEIGDLAAIEGGFYIDGEAAAEQGAGAAILGHPLNALAWLAEHCCEQGTHLKQGDVVTLGSVVKTIYPRNGNSVEARFNRLSPVRIKLQAANS